MKVGDYVAYVGNNGCLNGASGTTGSGSTEANAGNGCLGENANQSAETATGVYGYCFTSDGRYLAYGWRIAYIENGYVHLISAGSPQCETGASASVLNSIAIKYCNATYVDGGTCSSSNTWAMNETDFQKIINTTKTVGNCILTGTTRSDPRGCGFHNDLIDNGGDYWFDVYNTYRKYYSWSGTGRGTTSWSEINRTFGVRPVIKLSSSVYVTGGAGTMESPYTIGI